MCVCKCRVPETVILNYINLEVNPGPSGVDKLISSLGQNQNGWSENSANTLLLT